ncbi:MAG TPA: 5-carboxymethyl-2-hydroxymuconate semialdehyde dehydrogenase [Candidatus Binatia bacterium]
MNVIGQRIGNEIVTGAATFTVENPATGELLAEVAEASAEDVDRAVRAARTAFATWGRMAASGRAAAMRRLADVIDAHVEEIARLEARDTGLPIAQTLKATIPRAADNFRFFAEVATRTDGHTYPVEDQFLNYTQRRPVGVAGLITPWNLPFMLATWKLAPAIALGNTAVLKPAELAPLSADLLGRLVLEAGIPPGVVNVVHGRGEVAGDALVCHPDVNVLSFTGETTTGRTILGRGGPTLKRFSMELGGKSPVLVFADCDMERALDAALFGIFSLNGERCTAGSRILVEQSCYADFADRFVARARRLAVGDPFDERTLLGPLISAEHRDKVAGYVDLGVREGAVLATGGGRPDGLPVALARGHFLEPTVLVGVDNRMRVAQEEVFGPVACLLPFRDETDAVRLANDVSYGLAAYVWAGDAGRAHRVAGALDAGMVFVNSQNVRDLRTPFGGMKASGIGREGGEYSLEVYTELKNVCVSFGRHPIPRWGA